MKHLLLFIFLTISFTVFAQQKKDSVEIVNLLIKDYKTLGTWDINTHIKNCTKNYLLIENGEIWDMKKESEYFIKNANRTIDRKNYFDIKYIRVSGNNAYAVYNLKSDITEKGVLTIMKWVESAIFKKINGSWKIELIHSTVYDFEK